MERFSLFSFVNSYSVNSFPIELQSNSLSIKCCLRIKNNDISGLSFSSYSVLPKQAQYLFYQDGESNRILLYKY